MNKKKVNCLKYLTICDEDKEWGIELVNAGEAEIFPNQVYPPSGHPPEYPFSWHNGRILDSFCVLYITKGKGVFESGYAPSHFKNKK